MTPYTVFLSTRADKELSNALDYYKEKSEKLGDQFLAEIYDFFDTISLNPEIYQRVEHLKSRRGFLKKFKFVVVYFVIHKDEKIEISS